MVWEFGGLSSCLGGDGEAVSKVGARIYTPSKQDRNMATAVEGARMEQPPWAGWHTVGALVHGLGLGSPDSKSQTCDESSGWRAGCNTTDPLISRVPSRATKRKSFCSFGSGAS